ncbi:DNA translocase FtsK [Viridibacillus arenosi FSL R5-213]|uniref:DNA translocase FtsK n=1 Tax=Viridibacillus arenosi FSL R5-213 TaxID=1227360 RepID=W4EPX7_9BACL|nr:DNA translocase FtsK [Viridibacillus arenosi]ETT82643.1 DNA translocase FtsK [Viridibacillus arenosi FSL R5-213]
MKWFKNVVARIMGDEIEEYDNEKKIHNDRIKIQDTYEDYIEQEFETVQQEDSIPAFLRKRDAFRFPVISDSERSQMIKKETPSKQAPLPSNKQVRPKPQSVQPDQWQEQRQKQKRDRFQPSSQNQTTTQNRRSPFENQVQQYQESARFETREQRRPIVKNGYNEVPSKQERINPFNPKPNYDTTASYRERPSSSLGRRSVESETETVTTTKPEQVKKQKFKPTNVPSPVYGFQKPPLRSTHDQLEGHESNELKQTDDHLEATKQVTVEVMESLHTAATEEHAIVETKLEEAQVITETEMNAAQAIPETEVEEVQATVETKVEEVQATVETKVEEVQATVETKVEEAQATVETEVEEVQATVETKVEEVQATVETEVEEVQATVETKVEEVQATVETKVEEVQATVETKVEEVQATVETKVEEAQATVETEVEEVQATVETKVEEVQATVETEVEEVQATVETKVEEAQAIAETEVEEVQATVETEVEEVQATVETKVEEAQTVVETIVEEVQKIVEAEIEETQVIAETEVNVDQAIDEIIVMEEQPLEVAIEEGITESTIKMEEVNDQYSDCEEIASPTTGEEPIQQQLIPVAIKELNEIVDQNLEVKLVGQAQTSIEEITIEEKPAIVEELIRRAEDPEDELLKSEDIIVEATIKPSEKVEQIEEPSSKEEEYQEPVKKEESKLPFNVLMLKTDKEKWALKEAKTKQLLNTSVEETVLPLVVKEQPVATSITENPIQQPILETYTVSDNQEVAATTVEPVIEPEIEEPMPSRINENLDESLKYLESPEEKTEDFEWMDMQGEKLIEALSYFQVKGEIVQIVQGPAVTQFEITVGHGTKVSKIRNLADDLKLALAARDIRIQAPIPGKSSIGIEIPNQKSRPVRISEIVGDQLFIDSDSPLEAALGLDLTGKPVTLDLRKMPHGLIAGATGSGKSVCINSILVSLLLKASPQDVKLLLIDPKMVELAAFNHIPHLVSPVITDVKAATAALKWAVEEMERRYQLFAHVGARDITRYNAMVEEERKFSLKMPYLVIVIDELADLMMMAPTDVEEAICRIAQKARACGIHLVLATQRPSVDVITGLIKSNIPTRIAFSVSSQIDSRTILDSQGAERLLGRGDMLYLGNGMSGPIRVQGTFVTDEEIEAVTDYMRSLGEPEYIFEQEELLRKAEAIEEQDELFEEACRHICEQGTVSTSSLQRKFHIGYNRAARLVDMMEAQGFISESKGTKPRDVFLKTQDLENLFNNGYDEM